MDLFGIPFKTIAIALLTGVIPTVFWLSFWLREDVRKKEPWGLITLTFIGGMLAVALVLPVENFIYHTFTLSGPLVIVTAFAEEIFKFGAVGLIAMKSRFIDEPSDYAIYMITGALGFAALENTLFLLEPITHSDFAVTFLTGNLRFLGATVLHVVTSATLGIAMGLAYNKGKAGKQIHFVLGLIAAVALHSLFNFFIMHSTTQNTISVFGIVWVAAIIIMLLFEKLKRIKPHVAKFNS